MHFFTLQKFTSAPSLPQITANPVVLRKRAKVNASCLVPAAYGVNWLCCTSSLCLDSESVSKQDLRPALKLMPMCLPTLEHFYYKTDGSQG